MWQPYRRACRCRAFHTGAYRHEPEWYRHIQLPLEEQRGLDHEEDWWSPGEFTVHAGTRGAVDTGSYE